MVWVPSPAGVPPMGWGAPSPMGRGAPFGQACYKALHNHPLFKGMVCSEGHGALRRWAPLMMSGRDFKEKVVLTKCEYGTGYGVGALTEELGKAYIRQGSSGLLFPHCRRLEEGEGRTMVVDRREERLRGQGLPGLLEVRVRWCQRLGLVPAAEVWHQ